jgi:hypothetical protein
MKRCKSFGVLILLCGFSVGVGAQKQSGSSKPSIPIVSVVGCASRMPDNTWMLTNASEAAVSDRLFTTAKEIEEAKKQALGTNHYKLIGTNEFVTKDELLKDQTRAAFTSPTLANATGQLQDGRRLVVKGLLITTSNEKRLNLVSVQQLADSCK